MQMILQMFVNNKLVKEFEVVGFAEGTQNQKL
jgi:hypothetical protein